MDKPAGLIFNGVYYMVYIVYYIVFVYIVCIVYYMVYVYIVYYIVQSKAVSALCYISGKQTLQEEWQRSGPCINVSAAPPINTINTFWGQQRCFHIYGSVEGEAEITKHVSRVKANLL